VLYISNNVTLADWEIELHAIRAMGNGGQRVNKVATAIHLRFDINRSSLPDVIKQRLLASKDNRVSKDGIVIIKAQSFRTQEMNKDDALSRLKDFILSMMVVQKKRRPTKPTKGSIQRRLVSKANRKNVKESRKKIQY
jgi:ribosome-associated protein